MSEVELSEMKKLTNNCLHDFQPFIVKSLKIYKLSEAKYQKIHEIVQNPQFLKSMEAHVLVLRRDGYRNIVVKLHRKLNPGNLMTIMKTTGMIVKSLTKLLP